MKTCSRCGVEQPLENFRQYYNRGENGGHYKYCKTCESIESRRKYLAKRGAAATPEQLEELAKINKLYEKRSAMGLDIPGRSSGRTRGRISQIIDEALATE